MLVKAKNKEMIDKIEKACYNNNILIKGNFSERPLEGYFRITLGPKKYMEKLIKVVNYIRKK